MCVEDIACNISVVFLRHSVLSISVIMGQFYLIKTKHDNY